MTNPQVNGPSTCPGQVQDSPAAVLSGTVRPDLPSREGTGPGTGRGDPQIPPRIADLLARVARSRAEKTTIRAALQDARTHGLQARHTTKENRA